MSYYSFTRPHRVLQTPLGNAGKLPGQDSSLGIPRFPRASTGSLRFLFWDFRNRRSFPLSLEAPGPVLSRLGSPAQSLVEGRGLTRARGVARELGRRGPLPSLEPPNPGG